MRIRLFLTFAPLLIAGVFGHGDPAPNLLKNGGFEEPADANQAAGWCAWGGDNVIGQFQRVTVGAHSGQACMKLLPTRQYLINGRDDNWLRPQPGVNYRLRFWMRSDLPHPMCFWVGQYKSLAPNFEYAGQILSATLDAGRQWREYSARLPASSITAPILYLCFQPVMPGDLDKLTGNPQATLYLDDVSFTPLPADENELQGDGPEAVNGATHIAASPEALSEVDPQRTRPANRKVLGIAFHRVNGGDGGVYSPMYLAGDAEPLPVVVANMRPLHLPSTRVYAVGVEPWPVEETLERLKHFCDLIGVATSTVVVELEDQSAKTILEPEVWGRAVGYSRRKKLGFRLWEITNEPYASAWDKTAYFKIASQYAQHVIVCSKAIRAADPAACVGLSICSTEPGWGEALMRQAVGFYDFACPHYYAGQTGFGPDMYYESALTTCWVTFDWTRRDLAALRAANGGKRVPLEVTEWAGVGDLKSGVGTDANPSGTNIIGAIHRAIRQVWYLREDLVEGAMQWQSHAPTPSDPGFSFFFWRDFVGARTLVWYLSELLSRHAGDTVLADRVAGPMLEIGFERLPVVHSVCTRDTKTGTLHWVLVNAARQQAVPCTLSVRGRPLSATGMMTTLSQDLTASPVVADAASVETQAVVSFQGGKARVLLPAHSISFVEVR